jgi:predicted nucleic acid-binding protein
VPVADTELIFALSPKDPKHRDALRALREVPGLVVPDVAVLEFQAVLRSRGRAPSEVRKALLALREALARHGVEEACTLSAALLARQCELEERYGLSYFDSLVAASALALDGQVVSDDRAFDRVLGLKRLPLSSRKG